MHQDHDQLQSMLYFLGKSKFVRKITGEEAKAIKKNAIRYQENWKKYSKSIK